MSPGVIHRPSRGVRWEFTKNQTAGPRHRPHKSASSGGTQDSPCPTGFSEDSILRPESPCLGVSWICGKMSFMTRNVAGGLLTSCAYLL